MTPRTKHECLRDPVADKNHWSRPLLDGERTLGSPGWHERGYQPHGDFPGLVQFRHVPSGDSGSDGWHAGFQHHANLIPRTARNWRSALR